MPEQSLNAPAIIHHFLELLVIPAHYAMIMGLTGLATWVSTAALLIYVVMHARNYAYARRATYG